MRLILTQSKASENDVEWNLEYVTNELEAAGFEILEVKRILHEREYLMLEP